MSPAVSWSAVCSRAAAQLGSISALNMETANKRHCSIPYTQAGTATTASPRRTTSALRARPFWEQHFFIQHSWRQNSVWPLEIKAVQFTFKAFHFLFTDFWTLGYKNGDMNVSLIMSESLMPIAQLGTFFTCCHKPLHCILPVLHINPKCSISCKLSLLSCFQAAKKKWL